MSRRPPLPVGLATAGLLGAVSLGLLAPAPPAAAAAAVCTDLAHSPDEAPEDSEATSTPLEQMQVPATREVLRRGGRDAGGVTVAVLDSGISDSAVARERLPVGAVDGLAWSGSRARATRDDPGAAYRDPHGTIVAGLVAGRARGDDADGGLVGVAPEVRLLDVRVYDVAGAGDGNGAPITTESVVDGLRRVRDLPDPVDVATVAVEVPGSPELRAMVEQVTARGTIVVASAGSRSMVEGGVFGDTFATSAPGEDAAATIYPAGYSLVDDRVVAVTTTVPDGAAPTDSILLSSAIDLAAPSTGAVSVGLDGSYCRLDSAEPSWATAEVSGVLALLRAGFPEDSPQRLVARLEQTAAGGGVVLAAGEGGARASSDRFTGHGVVQPLLAVERVLDPEEDPGPAVEEADPAPPAALPADEVDPLAGARDGAVWWALGGGGALAVALLLRPVLARRRTPR